MKVPDEYKDLKKATIAEMEELIAARRRIATLNKWIEERQDIVERHDRLVDEIRAR